MSKTYQKSKEETRQVLNKVLMMYYEELHQLNVSIDLVDVYDTGDKPALTVRGQEALACIRCMPLKERVMGRGDVEITIDAHKWKTLTDRQKMALLDHELYHLEFKRDKDDNLIMDDLNRFVFKLKHHDREFGWFDEIARRWGGDSIESEQALSMVSDPAFKQHYLLIKPPESESGTDSIEVHTNEEINIED